MSNHLTEDQFAKCVVGQPTNEERQHLGECPECASELKGFQSSVSLLRGALRNGAEARVASQPLLSLLSLKPAAASDANWRWALVAATAFVLAVFPFVGVITVTPPPALERTQTEPDADALMRAVNLQLSRTIPAPMEPVIALLPTYETPNKSGGVQ